MAVNRNVGGSNPPRGANSFLSKDLLRTIFARLNNVVRAPGLSRKKSTRILRKPNVFEGTTSGNMPSIRFGTRRTEFKSTRSGYHRFTQPGHFLALQQTIANQLTFAFAGSFTPLRCQTYQAGEPRGHPCGWSGPRIHSPRRCGPACGGSGTPGFGTRTRLPTAA